MRILVCVCVCLSVSRHTHNVKADLYDFKITWNFLVDTAVLHNNKPGVLRLDNHPVTRAHSPWSPDCPTSVSANDSPTQYSTVHLATHTSTLRTQRGNHAATAHKQQFEWRIASGMCAVNECDDVGGDREGERIHAICVDDCVLLSCLNALQHFQVWLLHALEQWCFTVCCVTP